MRQSKWWTLSVFFLCTLCAEVLAQQAKPDVKKHEEKVRDMVAFLEYVLNTLGSATTSARDKDVLITESYTKIFRDAKVQIEDDLVEKRNVITNKDVQAYLKDVDFFYDDLKFEFTIKDIQGKVNANDRLFYKVSLLRNMQGTTVEGKLINNTIPRYIEINFDPKDQDLKIVSIYTNEFDEKGALLSWWKQLSFEWQSILQRKLNITDSVDLADIRNIASIEALDLSGNEYIQNIEPLTQLAGLQVLNLSNTNITDISPIRNLTDLVELNVSNTPIEDISALKYADKLVRLNINNTAVSDISVLERMTKLENLEASGTKTTDFYPLSYLSSLKFLNLEGTQISNLSPVDSLSNLTELNASKTLVENVSPLRTLKNLAVLDLDSTQVSYIKPLSELQNLKILRMNYTLISDLHALEGLPHIERIYCDQTKINREMADAFMTARKGVLVIYNSKDLIGWWQALPIAWQKVFRDAAGTASLPSNEELTKITNLDSINISNNPEITDIEPLERLQEIQTLIANGTGIGNLLPLQGHKGIKTLDISNTAVTDISLLQQFTGLTVLRADNSKIQDLKPLMGLRSLKRIYADETGVKDEHVQEFLSRNSECLVVYKTDTLLTWWNELPESWKGVFKTQVAIDTKSRKEDVHRLIEIEALHFKDASVDEVASLGVFIRLKDIQFSGTALSDISPLANHKSIRRLHATNSPVREIAALSALTNLEELDISNTPVEDLRPLSSLDNLKTLNCSGTQISTLSPLENLSLENLDCSNTNVKKLEPLFGLPMKTLKCYNTRVSSKEVEKFKSRVPDCNVVYYR
jgi:Leucine-rich repeat (LRR) protein